jgi:hypothetical protein
MLTLFGVSALTFMMLMYALERRGRAFILAFACGCLLASAYGLSQARGRLGSSKRSGLGWRSGATSRPGDRR